MSKKSRRKANATPAGIALLTFKKLAYGRLRMDITCPHLSQTGEAAARDFDSLLDAQLDLLEKFVWERALHIRHNDPGACTCVPRPPTGWEMRGMRVFDGGPIH